MFIPILLMGGIVGRLFREFAVTLSVALIVSLAISLTTTPMLSARFLSHDPEQKHGRLYNLSERFFTWILDTYASALRVVLNHPAITLLILLGTIGVNVYLYTIVPKGFFPLQDTGRMTGMIQGEQSISFQAMHEKVRTFEKAVLSDPDVVNVVAFTGGGGGTNTARMFLSLKDLDQRKSSPDEIMARIRRKTMNVPGATLFLQPVQDIRIGGRSSSAQYQFTLQSGELDQLTTWAPRVLQKLRTIPELVDLNSDQQNHGLEASVVIDRDTASRLGLSAQDIDNALYDAFGQRQVSTMYTQLNQYHVVMEVAPRYWSSPDTLRSLFVRTTNGSEIPVAAFTKFGPSNTPLQVNHQGQFPSVTMSFNLRPGVSLGEAVEAVDKADEEIGVPGSVLGRFSGTAEAFQASLKNEPMLIATALVAVYIVLGILYESYIHPITILSTLPSAGVGALLALLLCHMDLNVIALIGIILLIGIVKKNAIMMIDFALAAERNENKNSRDAIYEACLLRFRPITMTTLAALLGGLPLALATGTGAELRRPLGITIVGGLIFSQMLTLFTTPVVYLYMDRMRIGLERWRAQRRHHAPLRPGVVESGD